MNRRVVVTGLGAVTSLGCQVEELWSRILQGESGVRSLRTIDTARFRSKIGGEIVDWSTDGYLDPKEAKRLDRFAQFGVVAGIDAVRDSGIDFTREPSYRCGTILGSGIGGLLEIEVQHVRLLDRGPEKVSAFTVPKMMTNAACGYISIMYGLRGMNQAVSTACASATNAMGDAVRAIRYDEADVIVTGGTEAALTPLGLSAFCAMRALSERNDDPQHASRPFDAGRDGFVLSEGAGIVVVEELEHAKARGAKIYGEVLGYGWSADAGHITQPDQNGVGAAYAMQQALRNAKLNPEQVGYINTHGTSTPLGDQAETAAIKNVFGDHARHVSISSTKSHLGHLLGASGGVELIFCLLALRDGIIPPTINYETPDPLCDLDYTPNQAREREFEIAMSNSFGFGGHNGSLIVGKLQ
ncbi:MAG: beta-ketoacyl-ACP synthase II [Thermoguttaceae bacterium]|jgi:3-oxoacyl-[acyl-carrier-protein] synthase II|nr:beta-ketoacyl-ACP synthase II [Thermoguttaceae bacterium]